MAKTSGQSEYGCTVMELRNLMECEAKEMVCDGDMVLIILGTAEDLLCPS